MKRLLICVTVLLFSAAQAWAADGFVGQEGQQPSKPKIPLMRIYFVSGILDVSTRKLFGSSAHAFTAIHCSNLSLRVERIRIVIRNQTGAVAAAKEYFIRPGATYTFSTTGPGLLNLNFYRSIVLGTGTIQQGLGIVLATSPYFPCSAATVAAGSSGGGALALHMVRVNPMPNTLE